MPGPIAELILQSVRESDKELFRQKMQKMETAMTEERKERGEMTRDMVLVADQAKADQFFIDFEERKIGKEEVPPKEEIPSDQKEAMVKFLEKINQ